MSREAWCGYPWQSLRDGVDFVVFSFDQLPANVRPLWNSAGSPPIVPTQAWYQYCFSRQQDTSYTPWLPIAVDNMVVPTPRVAGAVSIEIIVHTLPGVFVGQRLVSL